MAQQNKDEQKKLLTEIMEADQKSGLYDHIGNANKMVTAVEWLIERIESTSHDLHHLMKVRGEFEQSKQMEKEQIKESYGIGHNDGCAYMTDGKTEFEGSEQYYNQTYAK